MTTLRSEKMGFYNLIMPFESGWEILNELGEISSLHFVPDKQELGPNKPFSKYLRRCEEMKYKLETFKELMKRFNRKVIIGDDVPLILGHIKEVLKTRDRAEKTYFEEVENEIEEKSNYISDQVKRYDELLEKRDRLIEYKALLKKTKEVLGNSVIFVQKGFSKGVHRIHIETKPGVHGQVLDEEEDIKPFSISEVGEMKLNYITGVINQEDGLRFKRIIFRISKGYVWSMLMDMSSDLYGDDHPVLLIEGSILFLMMYSGGTMDNLKNKIMKVLDAFNVDKYNIPEDYPSFNEKVNQVEKQLVEIKNLIKLTENSIETQLDYLTKGPNNFLGCSHIETLRVFIDKEEQIYSTMNSLTLKNSIFHGKCWCPKANEELVLQTLHNLSKKQPHIAGGQIQETMRPEHVSPPTYFKSNQFTNIFQEIVNTYGIPRYREINPTVFTIITFPFLFGVMFGDIAHGFLVFILGLYLMFWKQGLMKSDSIFKQLVPGRHLIVLMGFFSFYCGLMYNDFLYLSLDLFGSCYQVNTDVSPVEIMKKDGECVYPIGLDPVWVISNQDINFTNSYKMKLAVILGVIHMSFGIFLKALNTIHEQKPMDFFFEFIPQIIFMIFTFGYMIILIFLKWGIDWQPDLFMAPSIINIMIDIPLKMGTTENRPIWGDLIGIEQEEFQKAIIFVVIICVCLMIIPKPLVAYCKEKMRGRREFHSQIIAHQEVGEDVPASARGSIQIELQQKTPSQNNLNLPHSREIMIKNEDDEENNFNQVLVHTIIENIEFILGTVSNTASYLRLWALSLAHGQLSKVFFENTLESGIKNGNVATIFFGYILFGNLTLAVLMCMDTMECFLHTLRLHWVEFQNKFYRADGYLFRPFSFSNPQN